MAVVAMTVVPIAAGRAPADPRADDHLSDCVDLDDELDEAVDKGDDCGRWSNGRLTRSCSLAGTEFCDFECPYRDSDS
jgi:hypothetical protein